MDDKPTIFQKETFIYNNEDDFVGAGEFGEVFRTELTNSGEIVALKLLNTPQRLKQIELNSLMKEACILERLRGHPNVVHLKGVCVNPRHYALVLEFVDNGNLEDLLLHKKNDQPQVQRWYRRCQMGLDVARGMQFLHSQEPSIIHRDLKSSNVLVTKKYRCKISDFGLAKMRGISSQTTRKSHRSRHDPAGTLSFIAPERFTGEADPSKGQKVDVYGFGVVLWQLKEMKKPFDGESSASTIRENVVAGVRPKFTPLHDGSPTGLKDLISACWSAKPDDRPEFSKIVIKLVDIVESLQPDSGVAGDSQPMDTTNLHHSYSSSGGPLAAPTDSSETESIQNFGSVSIPLQSETGHPSLPKAREYSSIFSAAPSVSQTRGMHQYQEEPMDTTSLSSVPPTMLGQHAHANSQPQLISTGGPARSTIQPTGVQYPGTSQVTQKSYLPSESLGQPTAIPSAGQLFFEPSEPRLHNQPIIDRNPGLVADARKLQSATTGINQPLAVPDHLWSLKYNWSNLLQDLVVDYVIDVMFSRISTFSMDDMETVTSPRTRVEKAKQLLYWLMSRGRDEYLVFLDALSNSQRHLYEMLMKPVPENFKRTQVAQPDSRVIYQPPNVAQAQAPNPTQAQPMRPQTVQQHAIPNQPLMGPSRHSERPQPGASTRSADQTGSQGYRGVSSPQAPAGPSVSSVPRGRSIEWCIRTLGDNEEMTEFNSGQLFLTLSEILGDEWRTVGRHLGLRNADLENIHADHSSQKERGYQVLLQWTRRGPTSRTALYNALKVIDRSGVIFEYLAGNQ